MPRNAEQLRALIPLPAKRGKPARSAPADRRRNRDRLHIRNRRRTPKQANVSRERWLQAWLALLALQTLNQRRLLSTDVRARTAVKVYIKGVPRAARVLPQQARLVRLRNRLLHMARLLEELAPNIDIRRRRVHGSASDEAALDELMRVAAHDLAVLARPRLALVRVHDEVPRSLVFLPPGLVHEGPLEARREASTAAPT